MRFITIIAISLVKLSLTAQNVKKTNIEYNYLRKPLEYLDKEIEKYQINIDVSWEENEKQKQENYQEELNIAEREYQIALAKYEEKSTGSKLAENILLGSEKPTKRYVSKPTFIPLPEVNLIKSKVKLDGFSKAQEGLRIQITYQDFYLSSPEDKIHTKDGRELHERTVNFKQPVSLSLITDNNETIFNEVLPYSNEMITANSRLYYSGKEWQNFLRDNGTTFFHKDIKKHYQKLIQEINTVLNYHYGYSHILRKSQLYTGKGKKFNYDNLFSTLKKAQRALENITIERNNSVETLKECINTWEKELELIEPKNKKARINNTIGQALQLNIIEAKILIGDYKGAMEQCDLLDMNPDIKKKYRNKAEKLREFMKDEKRRNRDH